MKTSLVTGHGPRALDGWLVCLLSADSRSVLHLQVVSRQLLQIKMVGNHGDQILDLPQEPCTCSNHLEQVIVSLIHRVTLLSQLQNCNAPLLGVCVFPRKSSCYSPFIPCHCMSWMRLLIFSEGVASLSSLRHIPMVVWHMCMSKKGQSEFIEWYQLNAHSGSLSVCPEPMLLAKPALQSLPLCFSPADNQSCVTTPVCLNGTISSYTLQHAHSHTCEDTRNSA